MYGIRIHFHQIDLIAGSENNFVPGKSFSIETTGGIVSGIIISLLTAGLISTYKLLLLIILLSVAYVLVTYYIKRPKSKITIFRFIMLSLMLLLLSF